MIIRKIGLCVVRDRRILLVLKHGGRTWILPGGKPEAGEDDLDALHREVDEEIGRRVAYAEPLLVCRSPAADRPDDEVELVAFAGVIDGEPEAAQEIAATRWISIDAPEVPIAPSLADHVLPLLRARADAPLGLYHGTSSIRWAAAIAEGVLKTAPLGDECVSLTDDVHVARYFARNACSADGGTPVVLAVDACGLDARPHSSAVWGEGACDWERETACWENIPLDRVTVVQATDEHEAPRGEGD